MSRATIPAVIAALVLSTAAAQAGPLWGYRSPTNTTVQTPASPPD